MVEVLYEDNHLLAVNKPAGLATQISLHNSHSLEIEAKAYIKKTHNKPGNVYLHPIHRLDKPTSGVVLFAKTSKALSRLQAMMRERKIEKTYLAICEGSVMPKTGTLTHNLVHDDHKAFVAPDGKPSILHYKVIANIKGNSLVSVDLVTGRYHQIRAQFHAIGHPVAGDKKYDSRQGFYQDTIALHHHTMKFTHPVTHAEISISAPTPSYWPK
ncbi:MAG: RluA family pseudouridine synthase [Chlamydiales bacterium]|nr:RluA family pseudouridine synthase [Chlamydiales bacterium]